MNPTGKPRLNKWQKAYIALLLFWLGFMAFLYFFALHFA